MTSLNASSNVKLTKKSMDCRYLLIKLLKIGTNLLITLLLMPLSRSREDTTFRLSNSLLTPAQRSIFSAYSPSYSSNFCLSASISGVSLLTSAMIFSFSLSSREICLSILRLSLCNSIIDCPYPFRSRSLSYSLLTCSSIFW